MVALEKENYLKAAEMSMEDDYGMIDGIINNPCLLYTSLNNKVEGCKPKDMIGIPWMLAFALRDTGWYLRNDIIWMKDNPMPESVKDRCARCYDCLLYTSMKIIYRRIVPP